MSASAMQGGYKKQQLATTVCRSCSTCNECTHKHYVYHKNFKLYAISLQTSLKLSIQLICGKMSLQFTVV